MPVESGSTINGSKIGDAPVAVATPVLSAAATAPVESDADDASLGLGESGADMSSTGDSFEAATADDAWNDAPGFLLGAFEREFGRNGSGVQDDSYFLRLKALGVALDHEILAGILRFCSQAQKQFSPKNVVKTPKT